MANPPGFFVDETGRAHVPFSTGTTSTPTTGDWIVGNVCTTTDGKLYVCTVAGTGAAATWTQIASSGGGFSLARTAVKTSNYSAAVNDLIPCDTTSAGFTVTLPTAPADKSLIAVKLVTQSGTNAVTISAGGSDVFNKTGGGTTRTLNILNESVLLEYTSATAIWTTIAADTPLSSLDSRYTASIVAYAQPLDADLTAIAGLTSAADKVPYFTGAAAAALLTRDTDGTLAGNSDTNLATQKATKTYADTKVPKSTITQAGGQILGTGSGTVTELAPGTVGQLQIVEDGANKVTWGREAHAHSAYLKPTGSLYETVSRIDGTFGNSGALTSQTLRMVAISLPKGLVVTSISVLSGTTALSAGTNQWFALFDSSRVALKITGDDTSTAWNANTIKTLNLTSTFTTTYAGLHYIGIMVKATTAPSLICSSTSSVATALAPSLGGNTSDAALTTPVSVGFTAGAISASGAMAYAYVS